MRAASHWHRSFAFAVVFAFAVGVPAPPAGAAPAAVARSAGTAAVNEILALGSGAAVTAVKSVRTRSGLASTLPEDELDRRLARLLEWVVRDYAGSGQLHLLAALPEARNPQGRSNARLAALQHTYWLQDNSLYGAAALAQYVPVLGRELSESWQSAWQRVFPKFCPDTQSDYVVGRVPPYDRGDSGDPRCRLPRPEAWQFFREYQYPSPAAPGFDTIAGPIIGTDYPVGPNFAPRLAPFGRRSPRDLLKYGCLRQVLLGNDALAHKMFDLALDDWDNNGFVGAKNSPRSRLSGVYWTRDLAFALLCANALGEGKSAAWGSSHPVTKSAIEMRLWSMQSPTGGIWTNYCGDNGGGGSFCERGQKLPTFAKKTNEIAPLVLLAYGENIWRSAH